MRKLATLLLTALLVGCNGSGSGSPGRVDFETFVRDELAMTADDTEPADINDLDFVDLRLDDEDAFADLLR